MKKLEFTIKIDSPRPRVWETLWNDSTYRQWTSVFSDGSKAVTDWKEGSKVLFLDGNNNGMYSLIERSVPGKEMIFLHQGEVKNGVEQPVDPKAGWQDSREMYFLNDDGSSTELRVELSTPEEFEEYFSKTFPRSLEKVKELAEA